MMPPVRVRSRVIIGKRIKNSPPRIPSTDLLPVLITITLLRLSWTSTPVENDDPWAGFYLKRENNRVGYLLLESYALLPTHSLMNLTSYVIGRIVPWFFQPWPRTFPIFRVRMGIITHIRGVQTLIFSICRLVVIFTPDTVFMAADYT
jgi:hypothetical protein